MKLRFNLVLLIFFLPFTVFSQKKLTDKQILEDFTILKNVLEERHPGLYEYTTRSEWDSLFKDFEEEKLKTIHNNHDLYQFIAALTNYARDGHLIVMRPQLDTIPKLFPLLVKIIDGKLYTDTDDFGIPVGSEIVSIDGINGMSLRNTFMKYAPSDGYNTSKKDRQIEREFGILHFYEFGARAKYEVEYKTPSGTISKTNVESQSFESIGQRFAHRNSYRTRKTLGKKAPFLYFIDSLNTAVLTLNTFGLNQEKFQSELKDVFKDIKGKRVRHLVIDIRQNEGGYPENAIRAFSYLASKPFRQRESSEVITATLPEERYSQNLVNGYTYSKFFEQYYQNEQQQGNRWISTKDENEVLMIPHKKGFEGEVYVLIGGNTFSAGSSFALFCKNEGIPLIGEETGGGYYCQIGGYPVMYTLPNSGIKILISLVKVNRFVKDKTVKKGSGILPDKEVHLNLEDLIQGRDGPLDFVLKQIDMK